MAYLNLDINPVRFLDSYNLDVSDFIERHNFKESAQKSGKEINYMSYSHAYRLFRTHFPELEVAVETNPETNGFIFREIDGRGYFIRAYVYKASIVRATHDSSASDYSVLEYRSASYYYPLLTVSGQAVYPNDPAMRKNFQTNKQEPVPGQYVADIQLMNKSIQRAIVKAIALTTGIGLKLWTGEDLDERIVEKKFKVLDAYNELRSQYKSKYGSEYPVSLTYSDSIDTIAAAGKALKTSLAETDVILTTLPISVPEGIADANTDSKSTDSVSASDLEIEPKATKKTTK